MAIECRDARVHTQHVVLDIGEDVGALILYTAPHLRGCEIDVSPLGYDWMRTHTEVLERRMGGHTFFAAVFPALPAGAYALWRNDGPADEVEIIGGAIAEVDWIAIPDIVLRPAGPGEYRPRLVEERGPVAPADLPPRYRQGQPVSAAPMGAAPLLMTADGQVAWDEMWTSFCDLALAGGPPHRGTLLEPARPEEIMAAPKDYARVVAEIERGFRVVTGLSPVRSTCVGWVGLQCPDVEMARWLVRAIEAENVAVRREGAVLYLPTGPAFQRDKEIKNVVTVVAKTHHYYVEHRNG
jgi:hypothetical protein